MLIRRRNAGQTSSSSYVFVSGSYEEEESLLGYGREEESIEEYDYDYEDMEDEESDRSNSLHGASICQTSLLRTPTNEVLRQRSANSAIVLATGSTPSPLRSFKIREVSHISSTASRASGSTMICFSGADVSGSKPVHIGQADPILHPRHYERPVSPPRSTLREIKMETPSKGYADDEEDPIFSMASSSIMRLRDIPEMTTGPLESSLLPYVDTAYMPILDMSMEEEEEFTMDGLYDESDEEEEEDTPTTAAPVFTRPSILQHGPPPTTSSTSTTVRQPLGDLQQNSLKRRAEDGWKSGMDNKKVRSNLDLPVSQIIAEDIKPDLAQLKSSMDVSVKPPSSFRTPKRPFKTYSKRWWQVCTGATQDVRTITQQAHAFLRRYGTDSTLLRTVKEEDYFDTDLFSFGSFGLDPRYTTPEDPLNYQPPPLTVHY